MGGRVELALYFSISLLACCGGAYAQQQVIGAPPEASNMKLVGSNDLQARSAYQPTIHHQGGRWIAYIGHHGGTDDNPNPVNPQTGKGEPNGTSIVDVTDPAQPRYLRHIPGQEGKYEGGGAQMVRVCDGLAMTRQAVTKHLGILEEANLVTTFKHGREKLHYLNPVPIHQIGERWIKKFERGKLTALSELKRELEKRDE